MREIVHLQAGQCGNQIGSKVRIIDIPSVPASYTFALFSRIFSLS